MTSRSEWMPRAALVLALIVIGAALIVGRSDEPETHAALDRTDEPAPLAPMFVPDAAAATLPPPVDRVAAGILEAEVRAAIASAVRAAGKESKGRVSPHEVHVSVHVQDAESGAEWLALDADRPMRPASNAKLLTSAAAVVLLGPEWEFVSPFEASGPVVDGVLQGDLIVRAAGDPVCEEGAGGRVEGRLAVLAAELARAGLRRVRGNLVLDEGTFAEPGPGPEWPPAHQYWMESCALAGGFSAAGGVLTARVQAGPAGTAASVEVHPSPTGIRGRIGVQSVGKSLNDVRVGATPSGVTVKGSLGPAGKVVEASFAHPDPVQLFASVLTDQLERAGITVEGRVLRARHVPAGRRLAELRSPLAGTLGPINRHSANSVADQVFLAMGSVVVGEGTRAGGQRAVEHALESLGVSTEGLVQVDGSGLSRANRVTARQLTTLIGAVHRQRGSAREAFLHSLAVAGESGTLEDRMTSGAARGRVLGKTGWIRGTSALSGVALPREGAPRIFSILVEYPAGASGLNTRVFKPMHDRIATALVELTP